MCINDIYIIFSLEISKALKGDVIKVRNNIITTKQYTTSAAKYLPGSIFRNPLNKKGVIENKINENNNPNTMCKLKQLLNTFFKVPSLCSLWLKDKKRCVVEDRADVIKLSIEITLPTTVKMP